MLPNMAWNSKEVAVMGCGTVGFEIAKWLLANRANVTIYEPNQTKALIAHQEGGIRLAGSSAEAASGKHFVIGASGSESINEDVIAALSHNTYLISASSEQYEIDQDTLVAFGEQKPLSGEGDQVIGTDFLLAPDQRCVHVLANGYPINFWGMDSMPEEASDMIMSLILLSAVEVAGETLGHPGINTDLVNTLADDQHYALAKKFINLHQAR